MMFAGTSISLARLRASALQVIEKGENIFMPKNVKCITVIIILKGNCSIKCSNRLLT